MPRTVRARALLACALLCLSAPAALAESITWSFSTWVFPGNLRPDVGPANPYPPPVLPATSVLPPPYATDVGVSIYGSGADLADNAKIVLANMSTFGYLTAGDKAVFKKQPFQIGMGVLDKASNRSKVTMFTGYIDGTLSLTGGDLSITVAEKSRTLHIGSYLYKIDIGPIVSPGPMGNGVGAIGATVSVRHNPEPSALLLLGLGGPALGVWYAWRGGRLRR